MKKVMIGMLVLIPVLILVIVVAVSNFLVLNVWISVDDIILYEKGTELSDDPKEAEEVGLSFPTPDPIIDINDYVFVKVLPERANNYTLVWSIDEIEYMDEKYESDRKKYEEYLKKIDDIRKEVYQDDDIFDKETEIEERKKEIPEVREVKPAAILVDSDGEEVAENSSGKLSVLSYCTFSLTVQAETIHRTLHVTVSGADVESIAVTSKDGRNTMRLGDTLVLDAKCTPVSSIVSVSEWSSNDENVVKVDKNGVLTAVGEGTAFITNKSNKHSDANVFVESEPFEVTVTKTNSIYTGTVYSSKTSMDLNGDLGINLENIKSLTNLSRDGNVLTLTADEGRIVFNDGEILDIKKCEEGDVAIEHADIYSHESGYVVAVSDLKFVMKAIWKDIFASDVLTGVTWTTSNSEIATAETLTDGSASISAKSSGLVDIIAMKNGKTATITLNVQVKLVSMQLRTSQSALRVGLAQETVFASERFKSGTDLKETEDNSLAIEIVGAPKRKAGESLDEFHKRLRIFYSAYKFEVKEGNEFGYFDDPEDTFALPQTLHFNSAALENKGRQVIKVKVSAKYPKYENSFTSKTVIINVIYGVEVNDIYELRAASQRQVNYAKREGNVKRNDTPFFEWRNPENQELFREYNAPDYLSHYAICVNSDITTEVDQNGNALLIDKIITVAGDLYGNNRLFKGAPGAEYSTAADRNFKTFAICSSDVTVSNLRIRCNDLEGNTELTAEEAAGLNGECLAIMYGDLNFPLEHGNFYQRQYDNRIRNVTVEYCILENAARGAEVRNADLKISGCVFRNMATLGIYSAAAGMWDHEYVNLFNQGIIGHGSDEMYITLSYSNVELNNSAFANCLGLIASLSQDRFTYGVSGVPFSSAQADGRFVSGDDEESKAENQRVYMEEFYNKGIRPTFKQTGFADIYNWQDTSKANLIDTGSDSINSLLQSAIGPLVRNNSAFKDIVKIYEEEFNEDDEPLSYVHLAFAASGMSLWGGANILDEPLHYEFTFEDKRFAQPINVQNVKSEPHDGGLTGVLNKMSMIICSYSTSYNESLFKNGDSTAILPRTAGLTITPQFIARLHDSATASDGEDEE